MAICIITCVTVSSPSSHSLLLLHFQVRACLGFFLHYGLLVLASAGEVAFGPVSELPAANRWFHMSVSKNTAARFAIEQELSSAGGGGGRATPERIGTGTLLINLDADNIMAESYPLRLMEEAARGYQRGLVVRKQSGRPGMGGTCGRMATWLRDGWEVGMYDEEPGVVGSGSQDIDFKERVLMLARGTGKQEPLRRLPQQDVGICLANPVDTSTDWSKVKIQNCNPEDIKKFENWACFNGENCKIFAKKIKDGNMVRNQRKFGAAFRPSPSPQCGFLPQHARTCNQMQPPTQTRAPTHTHTHKHTGAQTGLCCLAGVFLPSW